MSTSPMHQFIQSIYRQNSPMTVKFNFNAPFTWVVCLAVRGFTRRWNSLKGCNIPSKIWCTIHTKAVLGVW